jgi:hypothetical protein
MINIWFEKSVTLLGVIVHGNRLGSTPPPLFITTLKSHFNLPRVVLLAEEITTGDTGFFTNILNWFGYILKIYFNLFFHILKIISKINGGFEF